MSQLTPFDFMRIILYDCSMIACEQCQLLFEPPPKEMKRRRVRFCSRSCSARSRKGVPVLPPNCKCEICGTAFRRSASNKLKSRSGLFFCSRACKDKAQSFGPHTRSELMLPHYSLDGVHRGVYNPKALREKAAQYYRCGYDLFVGILQVHHKDRDRSNNRPENLEVLCPNCHMADHFLNSDGAYSGGRSEN